MSHLVLFIIFIGFHHICIKKIHCLSEMAPQRVICEYVGLHGTRDFADVNKFMDFKLGRLCRWAQSNDTYP